MRKSTKNLLIGVGIAATAVGAVTAISYTLTKNLVSIAMDRKEPKIMQKNKAKLTGISNMAEILEKMDAAEEKLLNSDFEAVEIESEDGLKLIGHLYMPENPKRIIVAMHGWRSTWSKDFGIISDFWHSSDCAVLYAEQRAQGESEGEYMTFGLLERYDCLAWINWVNEKIGGRLPIYLAGLSMGATTILMTAGLELPEAVKGIIADCGFTSPHEIWKHVVSKNLNISYNGVRSFIADSISKKKVSMGTKDYSTIEAMRSCKVPVLFIHGTEDHFVPVEMAYENYKACAAAKRLLIVPGADHGMSYLVDGSVYKETVLKFWKDFD